MPKCRNDDSRSYTGDEPSPKGFGWCAHAEPYNKVRKGTDGGKWIISEDKNQRKFWKRFSKDSGPTKSVTKKNTATRTIKKRTASKRATNNNKTRSYTPDRGNKKKKTTKRKLTSKRTKTTSPEKKKIRARFNSPKKSSAATGTNKTLDEEEFYWNMIAEAGWGKKKQHTLKGIYPQKDLDGLNAFVFRKYKELSTVYDPYFYGKKKPQMRISDDRYMDLKNTLVGHGKSEFQKAMKYPKDLIEQVNDGSYNEEEGFPEDIIE